MKVFFTYKYNNVYPIFALLISLIIILFTLIAARSYDASIFLAVSFLISFLFVDYKKCLKAFLGFILVGGIFFVITYLSLKQINEAIFMVNRIGAFTIAIIPGISVGSERLTRNLSQFKMPRSLVIGSLIALSFVPTLLEEIKRVKEAMKTRGSYSFFNPKIIYRAFLIPFVTRIVDISDTLSLSIETRGFDLKSKTYTIYKTEKLTIFDCLYLLLIVSTLVAVVVL